MLSKSQLKDASDYENFIISKLHAQDPLSDVESEFMERWSARFDTPNHSTACLIDREIQVAVSTWKYGKTQKGSAFSYNCEVAHHMRDYRGLPSVQLEDDDQWDEATMQPRIAASDKRYQSDLTKHPNQSYQPTVAVKRKSVQSGLALSTSQIPTIPYKQPQLSTKINIQQLTSSQNYGQTIKKNSRSSTQQKRNRRPRK